MWRDIFKIAVAVAGFGLIHSALASGAAKQAAAEVFGQRNRNGLYRVFFISQSLVSFALLAEYIRRQPNRELYHIRGPAALLMHTGQLVAVGYAVFAAHQVGMRRMIGAESLREWLGGRWVPIEPEAQGPALDAEGWSRAAGPFAWSRHPLNLVPLPIFWLWPRMTTNLLAFNITTTVYLVVGSWHEEVRLREAYGDRYTAYQSSGIPFYSPWPVRSAAEPLQEATSRFLPEAD